MRTTARRQTYCIWGMVLLMVSASGCTPSVENSPVLHQRPNVVLILVDDLGWTDLGAYGSDLHQTPQVDRLTQEGAMFTQAYASCTVCSPTRAAIMTGKSPARLHLTDWIRGHQRPYGRLQVPNWTQQLELSEVTLAEQFKQRGYVTAHIGKWHLGEEELYWPTHQGFDINHGGHRAGSPAAKGGKGYFSPYGNPRLDDGPDGEYLTDRLAEEAVDFLAQHQDSSFFLNLWFYSVHTPLQVKPEMQAKYDTLAADSLRHSNATYAAMVQHMDEAVGQVLAALDTLGLAENTVVVFHSDNGGLVGNRSGRKVTSNAPLRSGKGDIYEGGVRVPLVVRWPGHIAAGQTVHEPAISHDLYPTLLALADGTPTDSLGTIDGLDLSGLLTRGDSLAQRPLFWHYPHYHTEGARPYSAVRMGPWKLIELHGEEALQLYHLQDDVGEQTNLADSLPERASELHQMLRRWRQQVGAQMPAPNPDYDPAKERPGRWING